MPTIVLCGLSHNTAPVELLERLAFSREERKRALAHLTSGQSGPGLAVREAVLLSTCNRVELYAVVSADDDGGAGLVGFLAEVCRVPAPLLRPHLYQCRDAEAAAHLLAVAAGLDSMVLGEFQILGQVRDAFEEARELDSAGPQLSALFRHAIRTGKRVRRETALSQQNSSVGSAAVKLATAVLGSLRECEVVIVGAGQIGKLVGKSLAEQGARRVTVVNRHYDRAAALARAYGGRALPLEHLDAALLHADLVLSCTGAPAAIITAQQVRTVMRARAGRPLVLVDLAVPRNVEPEVGEIPGVQLYNVDDLTGAPGEPAKRETEDVARARAIVSQEAQSFGEWLDSRTVAPTIGELRERAERIRRQELERALQQLGGLPAEQREVLSLMTQRIVNQLLHQPTVRLKRAAGSGRRDLYTEVLRELFGLDEIE
ncbi:MAG TPA: glutamyl-tRNA reductase [Ardenticatenaceae bacterium]|nr:glutamyl-tRNA reductase [Ardenticatenaceae bacterium]